MSAAPETGAAPVVGVVLAAGGARRFGSPKQLAPFRGRPLLEHAIHAMTAAAVERVLVVLGASAGEIEARVDLGRAHVVHCDRWAEGKAASLRAAVATAPAGAAIVVVLGDQPLIATAAIDRVLAARDPARALAVRATYRGTPGHPVVLEPALAVRTDELRGDEGAGRLLSVAAVIDVPCDGRGDPADVDSAADLAALEAGDRSDDPSPAGAGDGAV